MALSTVIGMLLGLSSWLLASADDRNADQVSPPSYPTITNGVAVV